MRKLSQIDQRLAARFSQRKLGILADLDVWLKRFDGIFRTETDDIYKALIRDLSPAAKRTAFVEIMLGGLRDCEKAGREFLTTYIPDWHQLTANVLLDEVPRNWLVSLLPIQTRVTVESVKAEQRYRVKSDYGGLRLIPVFEEEDPFGVPIDQLANVKLTDIQKDEVLKQILFPPPSKEQVAAIVERGDWKERLTDLSRLITSKELAFNELVQGFSDGENVKELRKRLELIVGGVTSAAQRIARTEGMRIAEQINRQSWDAISDLMTGVQIIAVLDENTRPEHATRNGRIYYKDAKDGQPTISQLPDLPDEPNCRCTSSPVLRPPKELEKDPVIAASFAQASGPGSLAPESYETWFRDARKPQRQQVVGIDRYDFVEKQLAEIRIPEWSDFIDSNGKLLTIQQLRDETATQRQSRKITVQREIAKRAEALKEIRARGFEFPTQKPTLVQGQTFSGVVNPASPVSMLGELVRQRIAKGVSGEAEIREVGKMLRSYIVEQSNPVLLKDRAKISYDIDKLQADVLKWQGKEQIAKTPAKKAEAQQKQKELHEELRSKGELARSLDDKIQKSKQDAAMLVLSSVRDMGSPNAHPVRSGASPEVERLLNETQRFIPRDWLDQSHKQQVSLLRVQRGYYDPSNKEIAVSGDASHRQVKSTMLHEFWHRLEEIIPGIHKAEKELYQRRTSGERPQEMSVSRTIRRLYRRDKRKVPPPEYTRRDEWFNHNKDGFAEYFGKDYGSTFYEIGTMGVEGIFFNTYPIEEELEVYDLILGLMATQ
jgi:SPP1 gp7 family putative phage head morphogenesis protein